MKIKRHGKEIELTPSELYLAWLEEENNHKIAEAANAIECQYEEAEYLCHNQTAMQEIAQEYNHNMDRYMDDNSDASWEFIHKAVDNYCYRHGLRRPYEEEEKEYSPSAPWNAPGMSVSDFIR